MEKQSKKYAIIWQDRDELRYHQQGETHGTPFEEYADEFTFKEAKELIEKNDWFNCSITEIPEEGVSAK